MEKGQISVARLRLKMCNRLYKLELYKSSNCPTFVLRQRRLPARSLPLI